MQAAPKAQANVAWGSAPGRRSKRVSTLKALPNEFRTGVREATKTKQRNKDHRWARPSALAAILIITWGDAPGYVGHAPLARPDRKMRAKIKLGLGREGVGQMVPIKRQATK